MMIRRWKHKILFIWLGILVGWFPLQAQDAGVEPLLSYGGYGARAWGMGRAFVGYANDPSTIFWNPAGLDYLPNQAVTLFHLSLYEGTNYDFIAYVRPFLSIGTFGFSVARLGIDGINRTISDPLPLYQFGFDYEEFILGYGKRLPWFNLTLGLNLKLERQAMNNLTATAIGGDFAILYRPVFHNSFLQDLSFGLNFQNVVQPTMKLGNYAETLPYNIKAGIWKPVRLGESGSQLNVVIDFDKNPNRDLKLHMGTEFQYGEQASARLGFDQSSLTFGAGYKYRFIQFDYGYGTLNKDGVFPSTHRISLTFNFGASRSEMQALADRRRAGEDARLVALKQEEARQEAIVTHLNMGKDLLSKNDNFNALTEFKQVLSFAPDHTEAVSLVDTANARINRAFLKQQSYVEAAVRDSANAMFVKDHFNKGRNYLKNEKFVEAVLEFKAAKERDPNNPLIEEALTSVRQQMKIKINTSMASARILANNGQFGEALSMMNQARELVPTGEPLRTQLDAEIRTLSSQVQATELTRAGIQSYEAGDYATALERLNSALKLDPNNPVAKAYTEKVQIKSATNIDPIPADLQKEYLRGVDLYISGKYSDAVKIWQELLQKNPGNRRILNAINDANDQLKRLKHLGTGPSKN